MSPGLIRTLLVLPLLGGGAAIVWTLSDSAPALRLPDETIVRAKSPPSSAAPTLATSDKPRKRLVRGKPKPPQPEIPKELVAAFAQATLLSKQHKPDEALALLAPWLKKQPDWFADPARSAFVLLLEARVEAVRAEIDAEFEDWVTVAERWGSLRENENATQFEARARASALIAAKFPAGKERDAVTRHVRRFVIGTSTNQRPRVGVVDVDAMLDRVSQREDGTEELLPSNLELAEERRLEELERLRNANALDLLDTVAGSLAWLALHQAPDGHISDAAAIEIIKARANEDEEASDETQGLRAKRSHDLATTALATLAFLDFRDQDLRGLFEPTLARAIAWLQKQQRPNGSFRNPGRSYYGEAIALMALGQAAVASQKPELMVALKRGLTWLFKHRGPRGGFRYQSKAHGDLSVTAWVAQAVETALWAGVELPEGLRDELTRFVKAAWLKDAAFTYMLTRTQPRLSLAPAGMLSAMILFPDKITDKTKEQWKLQLIQTWPGARQLYWRYYSMRMISKLYGGVPKKIAAQLLQHAKQQISGGNLAGAFPIKSGWLGGAGVTGITAMTVLMFEHALYVR